MLTNDAEFLCALAKLIEAESIGTVDPEGIAKRLRLIARKLPQTREWSPPEQWGLKQGGTP